MTHAVTTREPAPLLHRCRGNTFAELRLSRLGRRAAERAASRAAAHVARLAGLSPPAPVPERMSWWSRFVGGTSERDFKPQRLDYLSEALALERQGDYDAALTSYRLALRDQPNDYRVLQNMAIAFTKTGQVDEAVRAYRRALEIKPSLSGAHYGLAFLLIKRGDYPQAVEHLGAFLEQPPTSAEAERWVRHARETLDAIGAGGAGEPNLAPGLEP